MLAPDRTAEVAALLQEGIALARAGQKDSARQKILRVTEMEPNNEAAWLWLASLYSDSTELNMAAYCLQRAIAINPTNEKAAGALSKVQQRMIASQNAALATGAPPPSFGAYNSSPAMQAPWEIGVPPTQQPMQQPAAYFDQPMQQAMQPQAPQLPAVDASLGFDELKRRGMVAAKGGRRDEAKAYLLAATEVNDTDSETWFWLASVVDDPEDKQIALENVLTLDPFNEAAQAAMRENAPALAQIRSGGAGPVQPYEAAPTHRLEATSQLQWEAQSYQSGAFGASGALGQQMTRTSGPLQQPGGGTISGGLIAPANSAGLHTSGPLASNSGKLGSSKASPQVGDFIAFRYKVMSGTQGSVGMEYTAHEIGTRNFYTLRAQKCEVSDLKKAKVHYVVDHGVPYTVVLIGTEGLTLRNFVSTVGNIPAEAAVALIQVVLQRLQTMHASGPVLSARKQITPDTVTFGKDGEIALESDGQKIMAPADEVSQRYLPPELVTSGSPAPTSDIFAAGALLYFMLTGFPPPGPNGIPRKQGDTVVPPYFEGHSDIPAALVRVLAVSLQPNPADRYSSGQEMNDALAATGLGKKIKGKTKSSGGSSPLAMILIGAAAVAALVLGYLVGTGAWKLTSIKLPLINGQDQSELTVIIPTPVPQPPTFTPVPIIPLGQVNVHTVDTRRFPTNSVFFSALNANGAEITGITPDNVKIVDNGADGKNVQLSELRNTTDPVSVIFAIDNSMLMSGRALDDTKTALHLMVDQMPAGDQMALITFGGRLQYVLDYTVSKKGFLAAVDGIQPNGKPDVFPGVMLAAERTTYQPQGGYTALVVISNSPLPTGKAVLQATTHAANLANLPVFFVGLEKEHYTASVAEQLASQTGGMAVVAEKAEAGGAWDALAKVNEQLHNVYKLTYDSSNLDTKAEHKVEVTVTANGATQKATRTYEVLNK